MLVFSSPSPPTVCGGHHRTKVHLTGHRLPGALLTGGSADTHAGAVELQEGLRDSALAQTFTPLPPLPSEAERFSGAQPEPKPCERPPTSRQILR